MLSLNKKISLKNKQLFLVSAISIILLSIIISISNLGYSKPFIGDDVGVSYYFPQRLIKLFYYMWDGFTAPGKIALTNSISFLWGNFIFLAFKLGFSSIAIERMVYFLFFAISGLSCFFLSNILMKIYYKITDENILYLGSLTASLLYMLNHFTMYMASIPIGPYHLSYMLFPLVFALFIRNLYFETSFLSIFLFVIILLFLFNGQLSNTLSIGSFLIFYLLFFAQEIKRIKGSPLLFFSFSFILLLLFCSYIYLPIMGSGEGDGIYGSMQNYSISFDFNSLHTSFLNLFRLAGLNIWPNYPYYNLYTDNALFILLGYSIPIFVVASFLNPKAKKIKLFFGFVIIGALFFAKGTHPPFAKLFLLIASKIPYFEMYRAVYFKFVFFVILSYSMLINFFLLQVNSLIAKYQTLRKIKYIGLVIPFAILLYNKPFFTMGVVSNNFLVDIPKDYNRIAEVIKKDHSDFKVLSLPPQPGGRGLLLRWDNKNTALGSHPDMFLLDRPVLDSYWFIAYNLILGDSWADLKFEYDVDKVLNYTGLLNTKYIFLHKDFSEKYNFGAGGGLAIINGNLKAKIMKSILERQKCIKILEDSPCCALYKVSDDYFLPHVYHATTLTLVAGDTAPLILLPQIKRYINTVPLLILAGGDKKGKYTKLLENQDIEFIFKDLDHQDLSIELVGSLICRLGKKERLKTEKSGIFEIFIREKYIGENNILNFKVKVDGKEIPMIKDGRLSKKGKYIKIGELEIRKKGNHLIEVIWASDDSGIRGGNFQLVFANKKERENIDKIILQKIGQSKTGLCYIFEEAKNTFYVP